MAVNAPGASHPSPPGVAGLGSAVTPFTHTGRYFAQSWRDYLGQAPDELPIARPTIALAAQAFRDEVVLMGLKARRPVSRPDVFERITREVAAALEFYGDRGWLDNPKRFFAAPPPLPDVTVRKVKGRKRSFYRMSFDSGYTAAAGRTGCATVAELHRKQPRVRAVAPPPATAALAGVCAWDGNGPGRNGSRSVPRLEVARRAWTERRHAGAPDARPPGPRPAEGRGVSGRGHPRRRACDGQAVWDVRRLLSWIRRQEPESQIGLNGLSLGGYIAALVASLETGLTCAILGVPVADLVGLLGRHSGLGRDDPRRQTMELAEPIGRMTSPLSLAPLVPMRGRFIYAGVADQARASTRAGGAPLGALGQAGNRLVPGRSYRILPLTTGAAVRLGCAAAIGAPGRATERNRPA